LIKQQKLRISFNAGVNVVKIKLLDLPQKHDSGVILKL